MSPDFTCRFCDVPWDDTKKRFEHREDCSIVTGVFKTLGRRKKIAPAEPIPPLEKSWLDE